MLRDPAKTAKWLLAVFSAGVLALSGVPAFLAWRAGEGDLMLLSLPVSAWIVAPAALAAMLVARAKSRVEAWLFIAAEVAVVASTLWLVAHLFLNTGHQNAQSGVALILLPLLQFAALSSYAAGVIGAFLMIRGRSVQI